MLDLLASIAVGTQDSFAPQQSLSVIVVLAGTIDARNWQGQRLLVDCEITRVSPEYLEITCTK
jgi:hypothetical protein